MTESILQRGLYFDGLRADVLRHLKTLSTLVGLSVAQLPQGAIVAGLGFSEVSFPAPARSVLSRAWIRAMITHFRG